MQNSIFLASLCSWGDWFESRFVANPEDRFCRNEAHLVEPFIYVHISWDEYQISCAGLIIFYEITPYY